tara:strand:- start:891 stop:1181 length:291 start_codon:yes stop_codon:yes gene_type:complete
MSIFSTSITLNENIINSLKAVAKYSHRNDNGGWSSLEELNKAKSLHDKEMKILTSYFESIMRPNLNLNDSHEAMRFDQEVGFQIWNAYQPYYNELV